MSENTMMLVQATWQDQQTFRMIPISETCPYVECIFDPGTKVFVIITKIKRVSIQMLPKLDQYGQPATGSKGRKEERHKVEVFQEFYIEHATAVKDLVELFAVNADTFDYKKFLGDTEESVKPKKAAK